MDAPATIATIGNMGIVPEAIDFRPGTGRLYAIDVGTTTTQLYAVNRNTAAVTPVGPGFPTAVAGAGGYVLNNQVGFDFNPRTLMPDGSVRIRVVATNNTNLRLNSDTGLVAAVDVPLAIGTNSPFVDGIAYINSNASTDGAAGTTTLFDLDTRNDALYIQNPPNNGSLTLVGPLGATVDALVGVGFDIFTEPGSTDDSIGGDRGLAVFRRGDTAGGQYLLYDVNLATGQVTNGRLVGGGIDFAGGFAVVPEPSTGLALLALPAAAALARRRCTGRRGTPTTPCTR